MQRDEMSHEQNASASPPSTVPPVEPPLAPLVLEPVVPIEALDPLDPVEPAVMPLVPVAAPCVPLLPLDSPGGEVQAVSNARRISAPKWKRKESREAES